MPKINRYWNSDPDSLVEYKRPETYDLCKSCECINQLLWKEKRLKRALWLQRVKTAKTEIRYWRERLFNEPATTRAGIHGQRLIPRNLVRTIREWLSIWDSVEHKCLKKAEEYK